MNFILFDETLNSTVSANLGWVSEQNKDVTGEINKIDTILESITKNIPRDLYKTHHYDNFINLLEIKKEDYEKQIKFLNFMDDFLRNTNFNLYDGDNSGTNRKHIVIFLAMKANYYKKDYEIKKYYTNIKKFTDIIILDYVLTTFVYKKKNYLSCAIDVLLLFSNTSANIIVTKKCMRIPKEEIILDQGDTLVKRRETIISNLKTVEIPWILDKFRPSLSQCVPLYWYLTNPTFNRIRDIRGEFWVDRFRIMKRLAQDKTLKPLQRLNKYKKLIN